MPHTETPIAIECLELTKKYDNGVMALRGLSLAIPYETSFGLLGENGAGKSTLVRIIMGFTAPSTGRVRVLGTSRVSESHPRIGYVHELPTFQPYFTGLEHLRFLAALSRMPTAAAKSHVKDVLDFVHLSQAANRRVAGYSKGMLQRLAIAQALVNDPDLLILDEPTSGLDPGGQWETRQVISALRARKKTLLICSHYLTEIEELCDRVGVLHKGQIVTSDTVTALLSNSNVVEIVLAEGCSAEAVVAQLALRPYVTEVGPDWLRIRTDAQSATLAALVAANIWIRSLNPMRQTLEDVYLRATSR